MQTSTPTPPTLAQVKRELARRIAAAKARGDWRTAERLTFDWHRFNEQDERRHCAAKDRAAEVAGVPLSERMSV